MGSGERWATFDCYGTLIDWNGRIGRDLEPDVELRSLSGLADTLDTLVP
jgi:FMN phosphatase YigB (HAD superfamily)